MNQIESANFQYFEDFLKFKKISTCRVGDLFKVQGFSQYNFLIDINSVFSTNPKFFPIDRSGLVNHPLKWNTGRRWSVPVKSISLSQALESIVRRFEKTNKKINVFWSGGIDSTAIVTAFLSNLTDHSQLRIIYSPWSYYEHPEYLDFLKKFPAVELIDQSGTTYLDLNFDGIYISGNSSDEIHASLDQSFLEKHGVDILNKSWKDLFTKTNASSQFMDFCDQHFDQAGFNIHSVLEARWWFYTTCKINSIFREQTVPFLLSNKSGTHKASDIYGFFDCDEYEQYIYWNIDKIIPKLQYQNWKQFLKDYCYDFDQLYNWYSTKTKFHSVQFSHYFQKKIVLNDQRYIFILDNGEKIQTPSLPFFSSKELENKYGTSLDYLLNEPDKM